ncbi:MAG: hypothetical protein Kow0069_28660 [Promethearchaeota archaeon]
MTFLLSPLFTIIAGFVLQTALLVGYAWFDKSRDPDAKYQCWLVRGAQAVAYATFAGFGLTFFDTAVKVLLLGAYGRQVAWYFVPACVLTSVVAVEYVVGGAFVAPSRKGLASFAAMLVAFLFVFEYYLPATRSGDRTLYVIHVAVGLVALAALSLVEGVWKLATRGRGRGGAGGGGGKQRGPPWDLSARFKRVFSPKVNAVLWALLTVEVFLEVAGYTLVVWT